MTNDIEFCHQKIEGTHPRSAKKFGIKRYFCTTNNQRSLIRSSFFLHSPIQCSHNKRSWTVISIQKKYYCEDKVSDWSCTWSRSLGRIKRWCTDRYIALIPFCRSKRPCFFVHRETVEWLFLIDSFNHQDFSIIFIT